MQEESDAQAGKGSQTPPFAGWRYNLSMLAMLAAWPQWIRVAGLALLSFLAGALVIGWWPRNTREWRLYGFALAGFTARCLIMLCVFHAA